MKRAVIKLEVLRTYADSNIGIRSELKDIVRYKDDYKKAITSHIKKLNKDSKYAKYKLIKIIKVDAGNKDIVANNSKGE